MSLKMVHESSLGLTNILNETDFTGDTVDQITPFAITLTFAEYSRLVTEQVMRPNVFNHGQYLQLLVVQGI